MDWAGKTAPFLAEAERKLRERDFRGAHVACLEALRIDNGCADAFFYSAMIAAEHENFPKAASILQRAIELDAKQARFHVQLSRCLVRAHQEIEALAAADRALALDPQDSLSLDTLGVVFSHTGYHKRAIPLFRRAVALEPANERFLHNLGVSLQFDGDFAGAKAAFEAEATLSPEARRPYAALVHLSRQTADENFVAPLERQFARAGGDANARLQIGHALAKTFDDLGDYDSAFEWLKRAKAEKLRQIGDPTPHFTRMFDAARAAFAKAARGKGFASKEPIFVVGMPRSGTTLVDRILSAHPDIISAGELGNLSRIAIARASAHVSGKATDEALIAATAQLDAHALGEAYLASTRPQTGASAHFIDKMPINFIYAGLLHRALPNARIICLRRDPMDVCLANYRQIFNSDAAHYWYSYDLVSTARYYALFDALIEYWRKALPANRFTEVRYESVVDNLEREARRLVAFCGLPWSEKCLMFHENEAPVATASSVQVRSPIYASSIGRWRRYGANLDPLRATLAEAGIAAGAR